MTQKSTTSCPNCDTPITPGQRFCSNCGLHVEPGAFNATELTPNSIMETYLETPTPPPPPGESYGQSAFTPAAEYQYQQMDYRVPPAYAQPQAGSSRKVMWKVVRAVAIILVAMLAVCAGAGFFAYHFITQQSSFSANVTDSTGANSVTKNNNIQNTVAPSFPATTSPVNAAVTFADVGFTIVDVKQASNFVDDRDASSSAVLRVDIKESNKTAHTSSYFYGDEVRLLLANGTSVVPDNEQYISGPDAAVTRTNWIDFPVASHLDVSKLRVQLGKANEEQITIPLTHNPAVAKYQPVTVSLNKATQYAGITWTLLSATSQLSGNNQQAPEGQIYVIVSFRIDNNSGQNFDAYYGDYIRLQAGSTQAPPDSNSAIPLSAAPGQTGQTGTAIFLVPKGSTNFTFLLLANPSTGATKDASIPFQI